MIDFATDESMRASDDEDLKLAMQKSYGKQMRQFAHKNKKTDKARPIVSNSEYYNVLMRQTGMDVCSTAMLRKRE